MGMQRLLSAAWVAFGAVSAGAPAQGEPVVLGIADTPGAARAVAISGGLACCACGSAGLAVVDIQDPAGPVVLGTLDTPGYSYDVFVAGSVAYLADGTGGLAIIDISDPGAPTLLGTYDANCYGVHVVGSTAYLASGFGGGLRVVDVADPAAPTLLGQYSEVLGAPMSVFVVGQTVFVGDRFNGMRILDASWPGIGERSDVVV